VGRRPLPPYRLSSRLQHVRIIRAIETSPAGEFHKALLMEDNNNWIYWLTRLVEKAQQDNGPALSLRFGKLVSVVA
jgi:hypothetical protein